MTETYSGRGRKEILELQNEEKTEIRQKNKPLTTEQKLVLANLQRKRLNVQIMINSLDQQMQQELTKIATDNNIDIKEFSLNDDFEIIANPKK